MVPASLAALERQYWVSEPGNLFQRRARLLQSMWREAQGYGMGVHKGRHGERPLGSRLSESSADRLDNYLTETIRSVVDREVRDPEQSKGKLYARPRIFDDLLSSQPLCFNLFAELQQDLPLATAVFQDLTEPCSHPVGVVEAIDFEYSPGRGDPNYTDDNSAFDVYVRFQTPKGGSGFIGIEVKYHEDLSGKAARLRPRYEQVAHLMGCFDEAHLPELQRAPLQQVWRDHLLAGAHRLRHEFADGFFAILYPEGNRACAKVVHRYRECLSSGDTFAEWTLERFTSVVACHTDAEWLGLFRDRYLDYTRLDEALSGSA
jgi:hypothetical protein